MNGETLTTEEAARLLKTTPQTIRIMMEQGIVNFGFVIRRKNRNKYIITKALFEKETGIKL